MPSHCWQMSALPADYVVVATSAVDATLTVPRDTLKSDLASSRIKTGSFWFLVVTGQNTAINYNAVAALATTPVLPAGFVSNPPIQLPPGTVIHAIGATAGQIAIVRALIAD